MNTSITPGQKKQIFRVCEDAVESAFEILCLDKEAAQLVLYRGDALKGAILNAMRKLATTIVGVFYSVIVDYDRTVREMVAAGHYGLHDGNINDTNFPLSGIGSVEVRLELVELDGFPSTEEVLAHMKRMNLRPATLEELLAFGVTYPDMQWRFLIIALGSPWFNSDGIRCFPCLHTICRERYLFMRADNQHGLHGVSRFLAVPK